MVRVAKATQPVKIPETRAVPMQNAVILTFSNYVNLVGGLGAWVHTLGRILQKCNTL